MTIRIEIAGGRAEAFGPFPWQFLKIAHTLSGRKLWKSSKSVAFDACSHNIELVRNSGLAIEIVDRTGELAARAALDALPSQHKGTADKIAVYRPALPLRSYQSAALNLAFEREAYGLLFEMGLGKTATLIANAGALHIERGLRGVLIVAPNSVHAQWADIEIPKHLSRQVRPAITVWKRAKGVSPHKGALAFFCVNTDAIRTARGYEACDDFIEACGGNVMMIVDESHDIKSMRAARTKAAIRLGRKCKCRRIATGTPIGRNLEDAFAQMYFLDPNILGHKYLTSFRGEYCIMGGYEGRQVVGNRNIEKFYSKIAPHCYRLTKGEALNLPPKTYIEHPYEPGAKTMRLYKSMKRDLLADLGKGKIGSAANAAVRLMRLQQIVCGYLPEEESGELHAVSDERLDALCEIVSQREGPIVVWARFAEDIRRIAARMKKEGEIAVTYYGETKPKDRAAAKADFLGGKARILISTPDAGGTGLNLQGGCGTVIYYSNGFNAIRRWQSEDRVHRIGMTRPVAYFDLIAEKTLDRHILVNLRGKKSLADLTLDDIRKALK